MEHLATEYDDVGVIAEADYKANLSRLFAAVPPRAPIFVIGMNETPSLTDVAHGLAREWHKVFNTYTREVCDGFANAHFLDAADYLSEGDHDAAEPDHYSRLTYYRIFNMVLARLPREQRP